MKISQYRIKEFSKKMGVTVDLLKYYEKQGVALSEGREQNGYRIFSIDSIPALISIKKYRNMDFSTVETKKLISDVDMDEIIRTMEGKLEDLDAKIQYYQSCKERLIHLKKEYENFREEEPLRVQNQAFFFLEHVRDEELIEQLEIPEWYGELPYVKAAKIVSAEGNCRMGLALNQFNGNRINNQSGGFLFTITEGILIKCIDDAAIRSDIYIAKLWRDRLIAQGYQIVDDCFIRIIGTFSKKGKKCAYKELYFGCGKYESSK